MKINLDSSSGRHLLGKPHEPHGAHEVGADPEGLQAHIFRFNIQLGQAITLPIPFLGASIFIKSKCLDFEGQELRDRPSLSILRHELCHVTQIRRWGAVSYILRHLWARVYTHSVMAKTSSVEAECYEIENRFRESFSPD